MTTRDRQIEWIKAQNSGRIPTRAMTECVYQFGLNWFTDEQIEDMVRQQIGEWRRMVHMNIRNRKNYAKQIAAQARNGGIGD